MISWAKELFIYGFGLLVVLTLSSCASPSLSGEERHTYVMGNQSLVLTEAQVQALQDEALAGSAEAAMRLFGFYEYIRHDIAESIYWAQIAVENGDIAAEYTLGFVLSRDESDPRKRKRAKFWLKRSAREGNKEAEDLLRELVEE